MGGSQIPEKLNFPFYLFFPIPTLQGRNPPKGSFRVGFELKEERVNIPSGLGYASRQYIFLTSVGFTDEIRKRFSQESRGGKNTLRGSASIILIDRVGRFKPAVCKAMIEILVNNGERPFLLF